MAVLTGAENERIQRWGHAQLSTYGIGTELDRTQWAAVGRELTRLGLVTQAGGQFPTLELTEQGLELLRSRGSVALSKQPEKPAAQRASADGVARRRDSRLDRSAGGPYERRRRCWGIG